MWCVFLDPVYGDFLGAQSDCNKPIPFLEAVPVTIWLHATFDPNSTVTSKSDKSKNAGLFSCTCIIYIFMVLHCFVDIHALAYISNLVSVQLNHYQYLFLMRLADQIAEMVTFLNIDSDRVTKVRITSN